MKVLQEEYLMSILGDDYEEVIKLSERCYLLRIPYDKTSISHEVQSQFLKIIKDNYSKRILGTPSALSKLGYDGENEYMIPIDNFYKLNGEGDDAMAFYDFTNYIMLTPCDIKKNNYYPKSDIITKEYYHLISKMHNIYEKVFYYKIVMNNSYHLSDSKTFW